MSITNDIEREVEAWSERLAEIGGAVGEAFPELAQSVVARGRIGHVVVPRGSVLRESVVRVDGVECAALGAWLAKNKTAIVAASYHRWQTGADSQVEPALRGRLAAHFGAKEHAFSHDSESPELAIVSAIRALSFANKLSPSLSTSLRAYSVAAQAFAAWHTNNKEEQTAAEIAASVRAIGAISASIENARARAVAEAQTEPKTALAVVRHFWDSLKDGGGLDFPTADVTRAIFRAIRETEDPGGNEEDAPPQQDLFSETRATLCDIASSKQLTRALDKATPGDGWESIATVVAKHIAPMGKHSKDIARSLVELSKQTEIGNPWSWWISPAKIKATGDAVPWVGSKLVAQIAEAVWFDIVDPARERRATYRPAATSHFVKGTMLPATAKGTSIVESGGQLALLGASGKTPLLHFMPLGLETADELLTVVQERHPELYTVHALDTLEWLIIRACEAFACGEHQIRFQGGWVDIAESITASTSRKAVKKIQRLFEVLERSALPATDGRLRFFLAFEAFPAAPLRRAEIVIQLHPALEPGFSRMLPKNSRGKLLVAVSKPTLTPGRNNDALEHRRLWRAIFVRFTERAEEIATRHGLLLGADELAAIMREHNIGLDERIAVVAVGEWAKSGDLERVGKDRYRPGPEHPAALAGLVELATMQTRGRIGGKKAKSKKLPKSKAGGRRFPF